MSATRNGAIVGVLLAACGGATPAPQVPKNCPPQSVTISILGSPAINPTPAGQPRPVVVRVYQLKNDAHLYNAQFEQIWHDDKNTLGEDLVSVEEVQLYPAMRVDVHFERPLPVEHVAAIALFQDPKGRSWFSSFDLPAPPEAGKCNESACDGTDDDEEDCRARTALAPHYAFWIDGSKVDDGVEHLDDFPAPGPMKRKGS